MEENKQNIEPSVQQSEQKAAETVVVKPKRVRKKKAPVSKVNTTKPAPRSRKKVANTTLIVGEENLINEKAENANPQIESEKKAIVETNNEIIKPEEIMIEKNIEAKADDTIEPTIGKNELKAQYKTAKKLFKKAKATVKDLKKSFRKLAKKHNEKFLEKTISAENLLNEAKAIKLVQKSVLKSAKTQWKNRK